MIIATSSVAVIASVIAIVTSGVFGATMFRYRTDPTSRPLIGVAITFLLGAIIHLTVVDLTPVREALGIQWGPTVLIGGFWLLIAFDLQAVASGFWFLFALQYTGRDRQTSSIAVTVVGLLLALLVGPNIALTLAGSIISIPASALNALLGITIVLAESVALIGVFFILASTLRHKAFPAMQTALLTMAVGAIVILPFAAATLQNPVVTPTAIATSGILFTAAIHRYRIFETLPVASVIGRDRVIDEMSEGVVMVGADGSVRGLNQKAESLLGVVESDVLGEPLAVVIPSFPHPVVAQESGSTEVKCESGQIVAVTVDTVTDDHGRKLGYLLVCRDITEEKQREHRLGVLTQMLAGAIQEKMGDVADTAGAVVDGDQRTAPGDQIHKTATNMATLVARVRAVEEALAEQTDTTSTTVDLSSVVSNLQEETTADVTTPLIETAVHVVGDPNLLPAILQLLTTSAGIKAETLTLQLNESNGSVTVEISPFDLRSEETSATIAFKIAERATEHTKWSITQSGESATATVAITLPVAQDCFEGSPTDRGTP